MHAGGQRLAGAASRPWAFFVTRVQTAPDAGQALNRVIESAGRNDATVVLEGAPGVGGGALPAGCTPVSGAVIILG
ncbi:MAG: hypothetical protein FPO08_15930 [Geobacter sp.]|nr:MAG: hypothetical protein FPO08_15930 [Geobacter sp.]